MEDGFKSLIVWKKAYELVLETYRITRCYPKAEQYGMISQMQRAATSVVSNIAEGYERQYKKEYIQFLAIAKGSLGELETYFLLSKDLKYMVLEEYNAVESMRREVMRLIRGLIRSIKP